MPKTPLYVALPFVAAFIGVQLSGYVSDRILRSGMSLGAARKTPIIVGLLLSASILGANYVDSPELVIAFMSLAFFGNGMASIGWSMISHVAPRHLIRLTGGTFNCISNISGIPPAGVRLSRPAWPYRPWLCLCRHHRGDGRLLHIFIIGKERVE